MVFKLINDFKHKSYVCNGTAGGLLGTTFSLEEHLAKLGTNVGNFVPIGTFFYTGDIRGQKLVPKGTIPKGTFDNVRDYRW
jgi:hypothetical protein